MAKKKEPSITKTREITDSHTATRSGGDRVPSIDELLGTKDIPPIATNMFMLKLKSPQRLDRILDELKVESAVPSDENVSIVLGNSKRGNFKDH